jgi:hypothetical protein
MAPLWGAKKDRKKVAGLLGSFQKRAAKKLQGKDYPFNF